MENQSLPRLNLAEKELAGRIFGNHLTLTRVLRNLPSNDLFRFREVCKNWEGRATPILVGRPDVNICLYFTESSGKFEIASSLKSLTEFLDCLEKSKSFSSSSSEIRNRRFPCGHFTILNGGDLTCSTEIGEFFEKYGKEILALNFACLPQQPKMTRGSFKKLLMNQVVNVESLSFNGIPMKNQSLENYTRLFPFGFRLSKLKSLSFSHYFPELSEIIRLAPNLIVVKSADPLSILDDLIKTKKIHLIETLNLNFLSRSVPEKIATLYKFSNSNQSELKIEKLGLLNSFGENRTRSSIVLSKILHQSSESLTEVVFGGIHLDFFKNVHWPILENVKNLRLVEQQETRNMNQRTEDNLTFPLNFMSEKMPNLHTLSLEFLSMDQRPEIFNNFFSPNSSPEHTTPHLNLKVLKLSHGFLESLETMKSIAPNVEVIVVKKIGNFPDIAETIWSFPKLKMLDLEIFVGADFPGNSSPYLDSALTGLSEEDCFLILDRRSADQIRNMEFRCERRSILDCPDLTSLKIRIVSTNEEDRVSQTRAQETCCVAFKNWFREFGFKSMPFMKLELN